MSVPALRLYNHYLLESLQPLEMVATIPPILEMEPKGYSELLQVTQLVRGKVRVPMHRGPTLNYDMALPLHAPSLFLNPVRISPNDF